MKRIMFLSFFFLASANASTLEKVSLATAYIPIGFDNINRSQIMVEGAFSDTCYRVGPHKVQIKDNTITVTQHSYVYKGICADMVVPYNHVIEFGILKAGTYSIVDGQSGRPLGMLPVKDAPHKSSLTYPDDYLYAPVLDASVSVENGQKHVLITGAFTDDCTRILEVRVQVFGQVIQVLPITERAPYLGCHRGHHPFQVTQPITVADGHYLLHVRSLSGNAISKMVDIYNF